MTVEINLVIFTVVILQPFVKKVIERVNLIVKGIVVIVEVHHHRDFQKEASIQVLLVKVGNINNEDKQKVMSIRAIDYKLIDTIEVTVLHYLDSINVHI